MEGRIVAVLGVQVVHVVQDAVIDIDWHIVSVVGRGDVVLEVGIQHVGTAQCWETFGSLVMIDTPRKAHSLTVVLRMKVFWAKEDHC